MSRLHLVWIQIEGYGGGMGLPQEGMRPPFTPPLESFIRFSNIVCGWVSTVGSVSGLLTGVTPALLLRDHVSKGKSVDESRFTLPHEPITRMLAGHGYQVEGLSGILCFREQIPFFMESHRGVRPGMLARTSPVGPALARATPVERKPLIRNEVEGFPFFPLSETAPESPFLTDQAIIERVHNLSEELKTDAPKALFFHLNQGDLLDELLAALASIGVTPDNSVIVMLGDHGYPGGVSVECGRQFPMPTHDDSMDEYNLRINAAVSFPGCVSREFSPLCISWDLAPTILDLLGFNPDVELPKATGLNLAPWLRNEVQEYPRRVLRIENRYMGQMTKRAVCLIDDDWRYIVRPGHSYDAYGYLPYTLPGREELYCRDDREGVNNLVYSPKSRPVLDAFRREFSKGEAEMMRRVFGEDLLAYPLFKEALDRPSRPDRRESRFGEPFVGSDRVFSGLLALLGTEVKRLGVRRALLYGAGEHARALLAHPEFQGLPIIGLVDDDPRSDVLNTLPVMRPEQAAALDYDAVVIGSHRYETLLYHRCLDWKAPAARVLSVYRGLLDGADPLLSMPDAETASALRTHPCVLYAAGGRCRDFLNRADFQELGLTVKAILDSDPAKHGLEINGLPVYCYFMLDGEQLLALDFRNFLVCTDAFDDIMAFLAVWDTFGKKFFKLEPSLKVNPLVRFDPWAWRPQPNVLAIRSQGAADQAAWRRIMGRYPKALYKNTFS